MTSYYIIWYDLISHVQKFWTLWLTMIKLKTYSTMVDKVGDNFLSLLRPMVENHKGMGGCLPTFLPLSLMPLN